MAFTKSPAPIAVFAFNRPDHLKRTLQSLVLCDGFDTHPVTIFCDGPRNTKDLDSVEKTRAVAREILGGNAEFRHSDVNLGLARSIIEGVNGLVDRYERVIVVEDDLDLDVTFLTFLHSALERYQDDASVFQVSGYMFDVPSLYDRETALFLPLASTWGWATWRRAWRQLDYDAMGWQEDLRQPLLRRSFNFDGVYDYAAMLRRQMTGGSDSWGIRWYWTIFKRNGKVLYPPRSLVRNFGQDGSGTHGSGHTRRFGGRTYSHMVVPISFPSGTAECEADVIDAVKRAIRNQNGGWIGYTLDTLKRVLRR